MPVNGRAKARGPSAAIIALTLEDVAAKLQIPVSSARKLVVAATIQGFKVGNRWRVRNEDFAEYVERQVAAHRPRRATPSHLRGVKRYFD